MEENKWKNQSFLNALKNALNGIKYTFKTQRNLKIQIIFALLAICAGLFFRLSTIEWIILSLTIFLVLIVELINTAIETTVDMFTMEYNEKAKNAKDASAGAVTLMAIASIVVGMFLFIPKIINLISL